MAPLFQAHLIYCSTSLCFWLGVLILPSLSFIMSALRGPRPVHFAAPRENTHILTHVDLIADWGNNQITLDVYGNLHVCKAHIFKKNRMKMGLCSTFLWRPTQLLQPDEIYCSRPSQMLKLNLILFFSLSDYKNLFKQAKFNSQTVQPC